jgi:hypothetical protein
MEIKANTFRNLALVSVLITSLLLMGCQAPLEDAEESPPGETDNPQCTERWICQDSSTKTYRNADCTFESPVACPNGCESGDCKAEEEKEKEPVEVNSKGPAPQTSEAILAETKTEKTECIPKWICVDENRYGRQSSSCVYDQVELCAGGCKDAVCNRKKPVAEPKPQTHHVTSEGTINYNKSGWKYVDLSKGTVFDDIDENDFKVKLYALASNYKHFRVESSRSGVWKVSQTYEEVTYEDCSKGMNGGNAFVNLRSEETLCVLTNEKLIGVIGGTWSGLPTHDTVLSWKLFS